MLSGPLDLRTLASVIGAELSRKDERNYILLEDLEYVSEDIHIKVPRGFVTDLASIPRIAWPLIGPSGSHAQAAVIHDWLYRTQLGFTRRESDLVFREVMQVSGVKFVRRWILWAGVRLPVGAYIWHRNKKRSPRVVALVD